MVHDRGQKPDQIDVQRFEHDAHQRANSGEAARSAFQHEVTDLRRFRAQDTSAPQGLAAKGKIVEHLDFSKPFKLDAPKVLQAPELPFSAGERGQLFVADKSHKTAVDVWGPRHDALVKKAHSSNPDTALYGDSITEGMSLNNDLNNLHGKTANFGIHGDSPQNLRYRLEHGELEFKDGRAPKNFVVLIGTNDLGKGKTDEQIARDAVGDAELIAKKFPQSNVLLLGLLPRGGYRDEVNDVNQEIAHRMSGRHSPNLRYSDIGKSMLEKNGTMSRDIWQGDFTHPTYQHGNSRMLAAIKRELERQ